MPIPANLPILQDHRMSIPFSRRAQPRINLPVPKLYTAGWPAARCVAWRAIIGDVSGH